LEGNDIVWAGGLHGGGLKVRHVLSLSSPCGGLDGLLWQLFALLGGSMCPCVGASCTASNRMFVTIASAECLFLTIYLASPTKVPP
jgi:hypothetical protein